MKSQKQNKITLEKPISMKEFEDWSCAAQHDFRSRVGCFCIQQFPCLVSFWCTLGDNLNRKQSMLVH